MVESRLKGVESMPSGGHNKKVKAIRRPTYEAPVEDRVPVEDPPARPDGLDGVAAAFWDRQAPNLTKRGLLMESDADALAVLCKVYEALETCLDTVLAEGAVVEGTGGTMKKHPAAQVLNALLQQYRLLAADFGLTPLSRERMGVTSAKDKEDADIAWLFRGNRGRCDPEND
jgi:P27 family predicted phage terminase small subunit